MSGAVLVLGLTAAANAGRQPAAGRTAPAMAVSHAKTASTLPADQQTAVVAEFCGTCHSDRAKAGGLSLAGYDAARAADHPGVSEKMIRKLRAGMMPPAGAKRPDEATLASLAAALEQHMDRAAGSQPAPGWRPFQRLNRAEYARAVRDLLDVDVDATAYLPPDTISRGFDNVADAQSFSPTLMEGYLRAASRVAALAVGDAGATAAEAAYRLPKTHSQLARAEGAPLGTRGGLSVMHTFPADGDYVFRMEFFAEPLGILFGSTNPGEQIEVSIDGARAALLPVDPRMREATTGLAIRTDPVHVKAGARRVTAAFLERFEGPVNDLIAPIDHTLADTEIGIALGITTLPHLRTLAIVGPHQVTGVSETASRRKVFSCRPTGPDEEATCAAQIVRTLATQAFRRPVGARDFERLMRFYEEGRREGDFEDGVTRTIEAILASPQFLFRLEPAPSTARPGQPYRVADLELASRLSFFLWGSGPDQELLDLAGEGTLSSSATLTAQVRRMIADPRSEALASRFAAQWLRLQDVDQVSPDPIRFPYFDRSLGEALKRETVLFFDSLVREDRSLLDLVTADYTFVNERVARHYGLPNVTGQTYQRISVPDYRRGVLGHGSILTLTSIAGRTSPVMRGKWVMEVLLGSPPPPPPPNVPELEETTASAGGRLLSVRERMEEHRANPACNSCHRVIDPLGLALENFDVTGRWRIRGGDAPVDARGDLYDGTAMEGPEGLRQALLKHKDALVLSFTESLMTYALGRGVEAADMPVVRGIVRTAEAADYRLSAFIEGIVQSDAFRMSTAAGAETTEAGAGSR